jgi:hypothetical protein
MFKNNNGVDVVLSGFWKVFRLLKDYENGDLM